jgi:hypothetical protein
MHVEYQRVIQKLRATGNSARTKKLVQARDGYSARDTKVVRTSYWRDREVMHSVL